MGHDLPMATAAIRSERRRAPTNRGPTVPQLAYLCSDAAHMLILFLGSLPAMDHNLNVKPLTRTKIRKSGGLAS